MDFTLKTGKHLGHVPARDIATDEFDRAYHIAQELVRWFDAYNGSFSGEHSTAFALHHVQVDTEQPLNMFVVRDDLYTRVPRVAGDFDLEKDGEHNMFFPARAIFNPVLYTALPTRIEYHAVESPDGEQKTSRAMSNFWEPTEGCMSFPHRKPVTVDRFMKITVEYWYVDETHEWQHTREVIEALKSQIFQHELDHANGINVYHGDGERKFNDIPLEERVVEHGKHYDELVHDDDEQENHEQPTDDQHTN
jgi:hypothetical protein